jgi:hypothetical protein
VTVSATSVASPTSVGAATVTVVRNTGNPTISRRLRQAAATRMTARRQTQPGNLRTMPSTAATSSSLLRAPIRIRILAPASGAQFPVRRGTAPQRCNAKRSMVARSPPAAAYRSIRAIGLLRVGK